MSDGRLSEWIDRTALGRHGENIVVKRQRGTGPA